MILYKNVRLMEFKFSVFLFLYKHIFIFSIYVIINYFHSYYNNIVIRDLKLKMSIFKRTIINITFPRRILLIMNNFQNIYDESKYEILFKEFYNPLVQFAFQIINDNEAAKDMVQDIFVHLWEKELKFKNELVFRTYLYRSVQHKCINHIRKQKIQQEHEKNISAEIEEQDNPSILNTLIREEVYRQLLASIDHLPPQCKKICLMTLDGKKPSEIAQELDLAVDTVKKQKTIALKRLQDELGNLSSIAIILYLETLL